MFSLLKLAEILASWVPFEKVCSFHIAKKHPVYDVLRGWKRNPPYVWLRNESKRFLASVFYKNETEIIERFLIDVEKNKVIINAQMIADLICDIEAYSIVKWKHIAPNNDAMSVFVKKLDMSSRTSIKNVTERIEWINSYDLSDSERIDKYLYIFFFEIQRVFCGVPDFIESLNGELQKHLDELPTSLYTTKQL